MRFDILINDTAWGQTDLIHSGVQTNWTRMAVYSHIYWKQKIQGGVHVVSSYGLQ